MSFGSGPRVCIGQSFALARMSILATSLIKAFEVIPVPGETIVYDPRNFELRAVLNAPRTRICLTKRPGLLSEAREVSQISKSTGTTAVL